MAIQTEQSLSGFIASDPQLSFTSKGEARFYAKVGQRPRQAGAGAGDQEPPATFYDMVMYRRSAERAYAQFAKGDNFVAEGYVHPYEYDKDGQKITGEEFVAKKLGHDVARSTYTVDRTRRHTAPATERGVDGSPPARPAAQRDPAPAL